MLITVNFIYRIFSVQYIYKELNTYSLIPYSLKLGKCTFSECIVFISDALINRNRRSDVTILVNMAAYLQAGNW